MTKEELIKKPIALITLGCDKNTVDAEHLLYLLTQYGFNITNDITCAKIVIINTCAFIQSARKESIDKIFEMVNLKSQNLEKLIVTGCLPQKNYETLVESIPEVDAFVRVKNNNKIVDVIKGLYGVLDEYKVKTSKLERVQSTPKNYAFLKIADGCNNFCSYCTIPFIRGRYQSVPMEQLVEEAKELVKNGVKELILVAQDVTNYGFDLYKKHKLVELIQRLSKIKNLQWIRLHYCYPHLISDELLHEIETNEKVCKYLDIPLQHISNNVLKNMNRKDTKESIEELLNKIRSLNTFIAIRSTFIVGFPKENTSDFNQLKQFLLKYKLNNVGFFAYSREEDTKAYFMKGQVFNFIKSFRLKQIQKIQHKILLENQQTFVGQTMKCICEDKCEDNVYIFRNEYNSPNVDTVIYVKSDEELTLNKFYNVKILGIVDEDLEGEIV